MKHVKSIMFILFKMCISTICPSNHELELVAPSDSKCQLHVHQKNMIQTGACFNIVANLVLTLIPSHLPQYLCSNGSLMYLNRMNDNRGGTCRELPSISKQWTWGGRGQGVCVGSMLAGDREGNYK